MAKESRIPYKIQIGKGPIQTFYVSEEKMKNVRDAYDDSQESSYARFKTKGLDSFFIKADSIEQANLALDIWGLPAAFATTESVG